MHSSACVCHQVQQAGLCPSHKPPQATCCLCPPLQEVWVVQGLEASVVARYQGGVMASEAQLLGLKDFQVGAAVAWLGAALLQAGTAQQRSVLS